ncbi:MAG: aldehyde dehydrogenase (NADP(+)) [Acidimicrobiales bacterium]
MSAAVDPRTGESLPLVAADSTDAEIDAVCARAERAGAELAVLGRDGRARMLEAMADALEERRDRLVETADRETALGAQRLGGELTRTEFQLRLFAEVLREGSYLEAIVDHAGPTAMGPRPDVRRILRPIGTVGVFGASNFPLAFSVPGGDTASALAAGCPVVAKAHPSHPATSVLAHEALLAGAGASGLATAPVSLVFGVEAGARLVGHAAVQAVGFTGSLAVGRLLADVAAARTSPIPFYGELGALNAVVVLPAAAAARAEEIGQGLVGSFTLGVGQFCTKPGLVLVPRGDVGSELVEALVSAAGAVPAGVMLGPSIADRYSERAAEIAASPGITVLARGGSPLLEGSASGTPVVVRADVGALQGIALEECFGPMLVVATYDGAEGLATLVDLLGPALTATVHAELQDEGEARDLLDTLAARVGRIVWNGYPTGVAVSWAMHHGGPYPATTSSLHTSVGATAIRRWLRPVAYQDVPEQLLPEELRDVPGAGATVPRRVDGVLVLPG